MPPKLLDLMVTAAAVVCGACAACAVRALGSRRHGLGVGTRRPLRAGEAHELRVGRQHRGGLARYGCEHVGGAAVMVAV